MRHVDSIERIMNDASKGDTLRLLSALKAVRKTIYSDPILGLTKVKNYRDLALELDNKSHFVQTYKFEGYALARVAKYDSAIIAHRTAVRLSKENNFITKMGNAYMDIGTVFETMGELDSALNYYLIAQTITPKFYSNNYYTRLSINLGGIYEKRGEYRKSLFHLEKSLEIYLKGGQSGYLAAIYRGLGNVNTQIGAYDRAEAHYKESLKSSIQLKNNNTKFQAIERLANMKFKMGDYPEAISYYHQAIEIAKELSTPMDLAIAYCGLARTHNKLRDHQLAKRTIDTSLELLRSDRINSNSYQIPIIAGEIYFNLNDLNESRKLCEGGYAFAKGSNDVEYLVLVTRLLHAIHKKSGNVNLSLFYLEECLKYSEIDRSKKELKDVISLDLKTIRQKEKLVDSLESVTRIQEIKMEHDSAIEKEKSNFFSAMIGGFALLIVAVTLAVFYRQKRRQSLVLQHKNQVINQAVKDKDFLLKEVNHRVKNNMQMVSGLLQLKAKKTDNPSGKEALLDSQSRIHSMSLVHQQMYQEENYELINVTIYVKEILGVLLAGPIADDEIHFEVTEKDHYLSVERAQTLGFIIHELVTNSIKHAWKGQADKRIKLELSEADGKIIMVYSDNGIGLDENIVLEDSESFGLKMIHSFVQRQLKGTIERPKGDGTKFRVVFDISG